MKPQPAHSDSLSNSSMATATNSNSNKLNKSVSNSQVLTQLESIGDSCLKIKIRIDELADSYFSRSEMAAAEQLVQLSDHSDASCNTASAKDVEVDGHGRGEISSASRSAAKDKIEEIFGCLDEDDDEEEEADFDEDNRKRNKYGSLAEIYKMTKPLIVDYRSAKKVKYC